MFKQFIVICILFNYINANENNVKLAMEWIKESCVTSGSKVTISTTAGVDLSIKNFFNNKVNGDLTLSREEIKGLTNELNNISFENAEKVRQCLAPYRERIFNVLLLGKDVSDKDLGTTYTSKVKMEIEPNNKFQESNLLQSGVIYQGMTDRKYDYYTFKSNQGILQITLDVEESFRDYYILIYNKTRDKIKEYTVKGGDINKVNIGVPEGRKFIRVGYWGGQHSSPYKIQVIY